MTTFNINAERLAQQERSEQELREALAQLAQQNEANSSRALQQEIAAMRTLSMAEELRRRNIVLTCPQHALAFSARFTDHKCNVKTCLRFFHLDSRTEYTDPLSGEPRRSSGSVFVCYESGTVHVCPPLLSCNATVRAKPYFLPTNSTWQLTGNDTVEQCWISGRFKHSAISVVPAYDENRKISSKRIQEMIDSEIAEEHEQYTDYADEDEQPPQQQHYDDGEFVSKKHKLAAPAKRLQIIKRRKTTEVPEESGGSNVVPLVDPAEQMARRRIGLETLFSRLVSNETKQQLFERELERAVNAANARVMSRRRTNSHLLSRSESYALWLELVLSNCNPLPELLANERALSAARYLSVAERAWQIIVQSPQRESRSNRKPSRPSVYGVLLTVLYQMADGGFQCDCRLAGEPGTEFSVWILPPAGILRRALVPLRQLDAARLPNCTQDLEFAAKAVLKQSVNSSLQRVQSQLINDLKALPRASALQRYRNSCAEQLCCSPQLYNFCQQHVAGDRAVPATAQAPAAADSTTTRRQLVGAGAGESTAGLPHPNHEDQHAAELRGGAAARRLAGGDRNQHRVRAAGEPA
jgi:hypothetical protein